jgi:WXG100 family type VII secretion target
MNNISINPELLSQYGRQIAGLAADYTSEINAIYKTIDDLNNCWHGDSANSFNSAVKGFEGELKNLGAKIEEMGNDLVAIAGTYSSFNEMIAGEIGKL